MNADLHPLATVVTAWLVIYLLRALPFILFARTSGGETSWLKAAERWLSPAVIALLVIYSYAGLEWRTLSPYLAGAAVVFLQLKFRNGLLSIFLGTALYMLLIRL